MATMTPLPLYCVSCTNEAACVSTLGISLLLHWNCSVNLTYYRLVFFHVVLGSFSFPNNTLYLNSPQVSFFYPGLPGSFTV